MNVTLTDIRSLTLETPELPVDDGSRMDNFTGMMRQQMPEKPGDVGQVIEFIEKPSAILMPRAGQEAAPTELAEASWRAIMSQQQGGVGIASDSLATLRAEAGETTQQPGAQPEAASALAAPGTVPFGEILPEGGNPLPDSELPHPDIGVAGLPARTLETADAGIPGSMPVTGLQAGETAAAQTAIAAAGAPGASTIDSGSMRIAGAAEFLPPDASNAALPVGAKAGFEAAAPQASAAIFPGASAMPVAAAAPRPIPLDSGMRKEAGGANSSKPAIPGIPAPGELPTAVRNASPRGTAASGEFDASAEQLDALRIPLTSSRTNAESASNEGFGSRFAEMPTPATTGHSVPGTTAAMQAHSAQAAPIAATGLAGPTAALNALPAPLDTLSLARGPDATDWGNGLGERVSWMINQKQNTATIRLDPPLLGKLDVQIRVADDATTITIQTQHAQTRDLIETASLRLRDFLQESGYQNVSVDVSQRQNQQQTQSQPSEHGHDEAGDEFDQTRASDPDHPERRDYFMSEGLLDTFA